VDVAAELLSDDVEVRFLPLYSPEADALGAELAPALVVNRRNLIEGIPSVEEIKELIAQLRPIRLGIILTKAPGGGEDAENALKLALEALAAGDEADLFCLSDGVWLTKKGPAGSLDGRLDSFLAGGGRLWVSGEHLRAAGLDEERVVAGAEIADDPFDRLVDLLMEEWDRVVVL